MNNFCLSVVVLVLSSMGHVAWAAEPAPQPKSAAAPAKPPQAKPPHAKPPPGKLAAAKSSSAAQAQAKPKPAAPKYYYVRANPVPVVTAPAALALPAQAESVAPPELGEVHLGRMVCELGNSVTVTPDPQHPARFIVQLKRNTYLMTPVQTTTGAVRLEDASAGAMWLQLPHKSMLMNSKLGQRMADECQSEHQTTTAHLMKLDPPPNLLEAPALAKK